MKKVAIVIPTYNHCEDLLKPCIESVLKETTYRYPDLKIIVVANGCDDNTIEYIQNLALETEETIQLVIVSEAIGYTKATNMGVQRAMTQGYDVIVLLNNDNIIQGYWGKNKWLDELLKPLEDPTIGMTGPKQLVCDVTGRDFLIFFCVAIKRKMFEKFGLLDEVFSPGFGEDIDFCIKMQNGGYKLQEVGTWQDEHHYAGNFPIYHKAEGTVHGLSNWDEIKKRNKQTLRDRYTLPEGFFTDADIKAYRKLFERLPENAKVAEIGCLLGRSICSVADIIRRKNISFALIDAFQYDHLIFGKYTSQDVQANLRKNLDKFGIRDPSVVITGFSNEQSRTFTNYSFDLVFLDGDHSPEGVKLDIDCWMSKLKPGGILAGHDFEFLPEVATAVEEKLGRLVQNDGEVWFANNPTTRKETTIQKETKRMVYDCFPFFDELDLLEIRLHEIGDLVDKFVLVESRFTHSGKPKPLYFAENKHRFEEYLPKIVHIVVDQLPQGSEYGDHWARERFQREQCQSALKDCRDTDIIIISDVDEIPRGPKLWEVLQKPVIDIVAFDLVQSNYYMNYVTEEYLEYPWVKITSYGLFRALGGACAVRYSGWNEATKHIDKNQVTFVESAGWHFSFVGSLDMIKLKIESWGHQEYNTPEFKAKLEQRIKDHLGIYSSNLKYKVINADRATMPWHMLDHLDRFDQYIYHPEVAPRKVFDCFTFFNELDLLEIRLNELDDVVDKFVLVEAPVTHSGKPKPLYFEQNKQRFSEFLPKIIHVVVDDMPTVAEPGKSLNLTRENFQRNAIVRGLTDCGWDDIVMISDADEIPNKKVLSNYDTAIGPCNLSMSLYYYFFNCYTEAPWLAPKIVPGHMIHSTQIETIRNGLNLQRTLKNGGWHFSYLGGVDEVINKLQSFYHQEMVTDQMMDRRYLERKILAGEDIWGRPEVPLKFVALDNTYPRYILDNIRKYSKYVRGKRISIVIPTYNHCEDLLKPCIESILKNTDMSNVEVIIVANGCKDGTREYVTSLGEPFKLLWFDDAIGYTKATNAGIKASIGEYVLLMNNDCVVLDFWAKNKWLDALSDPMDEWPLIGVTGTIRIHHQEVDEDFLVFCCTMVRRKVFDEVGLLDEVFNPGGGEDTDFCIKTRSAGYKVHLIDCCKNDTVEGTMWKSLYPLFHAGEKTFHELPKDIFDWNVVKNNRILLERYGRRPKVSIIIPTYNHFDDCLNPCLQSILNFTDLSDIEIIIVANGCTDDTKLLVDWPVVMGWVRVLWFRVLWFDEQLGFPKAVNAGIRVARGERIVILNNDAKLLDKSWLPKLLAPIEQGLAELTGPQLIPYERYNAQALFFFCVAIKREVFEKIGLLDPAFGIGRGEDIDFCIRAAKAGYRMVQVGDTVDKLKQHGTFPIQHNAGTTFTALPNYNEIADLHMDILDRKYRPNRAVHIITPTYNRHTQLEQLMAEILHQTYSNVHAWICADGPDPEVETLVNHFNDESHGNVKFHYSCMAKKEGFWGAPIRRSLLEGIPDDGAVCFVDDDNQIYPEYCEKLVAGITDLIGITYCNIRMNSPLFPPKHVVPGHDCLGQFERGNIDSLNFMVRTDVAKKHKDAWLNEYYHDYNFLIECAKENLALSVYIPDILGEHGRDDVRTTVVEPSKPVAVEVKQKPCEHLKGQPEYQEIIEGNTYHIEPSDFKDKYVVDIGANIGLVSLLAVEYGAKKVFAIEPDKGNFANLQRNTEPYSQIQLFNMAVNDGTSRYVTMIDAGVTARSMNSDQGVLAITLSNFAGIYLPEGVQDAVLKIDCEGAEHAILHSTPKEVIRRFSIIFLEIHGNRPGQVQHKQFPYDHDELLSYVQGMGYADVMQTYFFVDYPQADGTKVRVDSFATIHKLVRVVESMKPLGPPILFVDDEKQPEWYGLRKEDVLFADTVSKAEKFAEEHKSFVLYLDQDMGAKDGNPTKGVLLLQWFVERHYDIKEVVCISRNYFGVLEIEAVCKGCNIKYSHRFPNQQEMQTFNPPEPSKPIPEPPLPHGPGVDFVDDRPIVTSMPVPRFDEPQEDRSVTAMISTKDRYFSTLPLAIESIALQTFKPKELVIFDDGEGKDLRPIPLYQNLLALLSRKGIAWRILFGAKKGQVLNHQAILEMATTPFVWRLDDDNVAEEHTLEYLMSSMKPGVGAVGGLVLDPKLPPTPSSLASSKIEDIYLGLNTQWYPHEKEDVVEVDHLYSTFVYRREAGKHGYQKDLSPAGHREETMFTYEMKRAGWKLLVNPKAITWHVRDPQGGIRSNAQQQFWQKDEQIFSGKMKEWDVKPTNFKFIILDNGLGDHIAFSTILPELRTRFAGSTIVIAACYPEVFEKETDLRLISIADAIGMFGNLSGYDIYQFMGDQNWKGTLRDAFRAMYLR